MFSLGRVDNLRRKLGQLTQLGIVTRPTLFYIRVSHLLFQSDASALQAVHGRELPLHRRPEPHQLQHALRAEDAHDYLSRNGATRFHGHALDHCKLDAPTM